MVQRSHRTVYAHDSGTALSLDSRNDPIEYQGSWRLPVREACMRFSRGADGVCRALDCGVLSAHATSRPEAQDASPSMAGECTADTHLYAGRSGSAIYRVFGHHHAPDYKQWRDV